MEKCLLYMQVSKFKIPELTQKPAAAVCMQPQHLGRERGGQRQVDPWNSLAGQTSQWMNSRVNKIKVKKKLSKISTSTSGLHIHAQSHTNTHMQQTHTHTHTYMYVHTEAYGNKMPFLPMRQIKLKY